MYIRLSQIQPPNHRDAAHQRIEAFPASTVIASSWHRLALSFSSTSTPRNSFPTSARYPSDSSLRDKAVVSVRLAPHLPAFSLDYSAAFACHSSLTTFSTPSRPASPAEIRTRCHHQPAPTTTRRSSSLRQIKHPPPLPLFSTPPAATVAATAATSVATAVTSTLAVATALATAPVTAIASAFCGGHCAAGRPLLQRVTREQHLLRHTRCHYYSGCTQYSVLATTIALWRDQLPRPLIRPTRWPQLRTNS